MSNSDLNKRIEETAKLLKSLQQQKVLEDNKDLFTKLYKYVGTKEVSYYSFKPCAVNPERLIFQKLTVENCGVFSCIRNTATIGYFAREVERGNMLPCSEYDFKVAVGTFSDFWTSMIK